MIDSFGRFLAITALLAANLTFANAQDVRGIEICTVEKQVERRTSCLQSNVEFLHQLVTKQAREASDRLAAAGRENAAAKAEIAGLKESLVKLRAEIDELKKPKPQQKN